MRMLDQEADATFPPVDTIEFIGGPRAGERESDEGQDKSIPAPGGVYERSVRCTDDGALRYVWRPDLVAHG